MQRASLGVQEFDEKVQTAINRVQPVSMIESTLSLLREQGVKGVNFDLMYGLPYQTVETLRDTVEQAARLARPDRIALFGYAHVPWMAKNQKMLPEEALPTPLMRYEQAKVAGDALAGQGYVKIGLDHFARPEDPWRSPCAKAAFTGTSRAIPTTRPAPSSGSEQARSRPWRKALRRTSWRPGPIPAR